MKFPFLLIAMLPLALSDASAGASAIARTRDTTAVKATIDALLAGVAAHDSAAMLAVLRQEGNATIAAEKSDGTHVIRHLSWDDFVAGAKPGPQKFEPKLRNITIKVDGDIAMAWTPYVFYVDGKLHHCGVNHFDLVREDGAWKILNVTYSLRTVGCKA